MLQFPRMNAVKPKITFDVSTLTKDQAQAATALFRNEQNPTFLGDMLSAFYVYLNTDTDYSKENWVISINAREKAKLDAVLRSAQERE